MLNSAATVHRPMKACPPPQLLIQIDISKYQNLRLQHFSEMKHYHSSMRATLKLQVRKIYKQQATIEIVATITTPASVRTNTCKMQLYKLQRYVLVYETQRNYHHLFVCSDAWIGIQLNMMNVARSYFLPMLAMSSPNFKLHSMLELTSYRLSRNKKASYRFGMQQGSKAHNAFDTCN